MKQVIKMRIRNQAWKFAWDENKNKYSMLEVAEVFNVPLPTFFRVVKSEEENKKVGK